VSKASQSGLFSETIVERPLLAGKVASEPRRIGGWRDSTFYLETISKS